MYSVKVNSYPFIKWFNSFDDKVARLLLWLLHPI